MNFPQNPRPPRMPRQRLDVLLVERGLFPTRSKAQAAIMAGKVRVEGVARPKAGASVSPDIGVEILADAVPYVSRGGLKLAAGLDGFSIEPKGRVAVDVGASTGGFTDCLLQRGAAKIYAVDVGHGQLDAKLRSDPRVACMEGTHARDLAPVMFGEDAGKLDLAVIDVSFISLRKVLPPTLACLKRDFDVVALIKPQFELTPKQAPKGVVRDEEHRREAVEGLREFARSLPVTDRGVLESPVKGPKGNVEYLWHLTNA